MNDDTRVLAPAARGRGLIPPSRNRFQRGRGDRFPGGPLIGSATSLLTDPFFNLQPLRCCPEVPDARRLKDLESENNRLKRLVAEQMPVIEGMKEVVRKK